MVQLREESVTTPKTPKMAKTKTPKKNAAVETPKMNKKSPKVPEMKGIPMTPESITASGKKKKSKTPKNKKVDSEEDVEIKQIEVEVPETPKRVTGSAKKQNKNKKVATPVKTSDEDMESAEEEQEEEEVTPKQESRSIAGSAKKQKQNKNKKVASPVKASDDSDEDMESAGEEEEEEEKEEEEEDEEEEEEVTTKEESQSDEKSSDEAEEEEKIVTVKSAKKQTKKNAQSDGEGFTVYVKDINFTTSFKTFSTHFRQFGQLTRSFLSSNKRIRGRNLGFGFMTFSTEEQMEKALNASHAVDGRTLQVVKANDKKQDSPKRKREGGDDDGPARKKPSFEHEAFVAKLSMESTPETVKEHFSKYGTVVNVAIPKKVGGEGHKGFGFVAFEDASGLEAALAVEKHEVDSRVIVVRGKKEEKVEAPREKPQHANEVYVGGLDFSTQRGTVEKHFSKYGKVSNITLPWNKLRSSNKGFAFVAFETPESLEGALAVDHQIDGATLMLRLGEKTVTAKTVKKDAKAAKNGKKAPAKEEKIEEEEDDEEEEGEEAADEEDNEADDDDDEADDDADDDDEEADDDDDDDDE